jgi:uncharacterized protein
MEIAGRKEEILLLKSLLLKKESSFLAVYGRRRIGKTYLIREVYEKEIVFECSGVLGESTSQQLENFWRTLIRVNPAAPPTVLPRTWLEAFYQLRTYFDDLPQEQKKVIFLDEIPWFETRRSGFLAALDNFWNQYCTKRKDIILVICGSAASWIMEKVVNNRGGLHNRLTHRLLLKPFTLGETKAFFELNNVRLEPKAIAEIYMCVGGIPFYLKEISAGKSVQQILDHLFFKEQASLKDEFRNLYAALFKNSSLHERIVTALASKNKGLTRNEIIATADLQSSGELTLALDELKQCGFVHQYFPIQKAKEDSLYRLVDEYSLFYFKFIRDKEVNSSWAILSQSQKFKTWSGYAFENICFKHIDQIKKALGIQGIISNEYSYIFKGDENTPGIQIDLVLDRADNCINLIEVKFQDKEFVVTSEYAKQLRLKASVFKEKTRTKKSIFITMVTAEGVQINEHYLSSVTNQFLIEDLF